MLRDERISKIFEMAKSRKFVSIHEIMRELNLSKSTAFRDINELHKAGRIEKTRGGIMYLQSDSEKPEQANARTRSLLFPAQKTRIAVKAMEYIRNFSSIFLDSGTTTMAIAKEIKDSLDRPLMVATYDLSIARELSQCPMCEILLVGGLLRPNFNSTTGYFTDLMLRELHLDAVFLGADSVHPRDGVMNFSAPMISNKKIITSQISERIILVCDYSKFTTHSLYKVCEMRDLHAVITNTELDPELVLQMRADGIKVDLV